MENATKALMIAGAVLIAIMIISIGMLIYQNSVGTVNNAISRMSQQEKQIFNAQFESYEGVQKGSNVKTLISAIITSNTQMVLEDTTEKLVSFNGETDTAKLEEARRTIVSGSNYDVQVSQDTNGLITTITAERKTGTGTGSGSGTGTGTGTTTN